MLLNSALSVILPALVPVVSDGVRGVFAKYTGGAGGSPQNVDERIKLMQAENDRVRALAEIDKPSGEVSQWVANVRGIFRYGAIAGIWGVTTICIFSDVDKSITLVMLDLSGASMSFIIGERMHLRLKKE